MSQPSERLYRLLPALYRARDLDQGEPLRALVGVLEEELLRVQADIQGLYNNWFVETCDEWVLPYLGGLLGVQPLQTISSRAFVANSLAHRRRKGTLRTLEAVARDITGWPARAVDFIQLSATNQNVNSERPAAVVIPDLRQPGGELVGGPFEGVAHTIDVRSTGRYHPAAIGVFLWRLEAYPLKGVPATPVPTSETTVSGCFRVSPLGRDQSLWSPRDTGGGLAATTEENSVPEPLRLRALYDALEAHRQALADGRTPHNPYFARQPVLRVLVPGADGTPQAIPPEQILVADLSTWWKPPASKPYRSNLGKDVTLPIGVAVDPALGRLAFPGQPGSVWVSYYYGCASALGGGGYDRAETLPAVDSVPGVTFVQLDPGDPKGVLTSGQLADLAAGANRLVVELADSQSYGIADQTLPKGLQVELRARNLHRPLLKPKGGTSAWSVSMGDGAALSLNGLLLPASVNLSSSTGGGSATVSLTHCTLVPGQNLSASSAFQRLDLNISYSITGAVLLQSPAGTVLLSTSIVDGANGAVDLSLPALQAPTARVQYSTVFGAAKVTSRLDASDSLFCGPVVAPANNAGSVSYCYLPDGSSVPQTFRCQPALAQSADGADPNLVKARVRPSLTSRQYGAPGYGQLTARCAPELRQGASDGGELGALHDLYEAQREANLLLRSAEYVRFGMLMNLFYAT